MSSRLRNGEGLARRDFLRIGSAGLFGLGLPQVLELEARARAAAPERTRNQRARSVILVWLNGGPPTIDMWDLKPHAPDGIRGEFRPMATRAGGVQICEHLPRMAAVMDKCTVVRSLAHTVPEHGLATTFMTTGNRPTPVLRYPDLGSLVARLAATQSGAAPFVAVRAPGGQPFGGVAGHLGPAYDPFEVEVTRRAPTDDAVVDTRGVVLPADFPVAQLDNRNALAQSFDRAFAAADRNPELANGLDSFHRQALDILRSNRTRDALNLGREQRSLRERYGQTLFGQGCLAARRLIEAGVRFVTVTSELIWDTHGQNFSTLRTQNLPQLDQALSALIRDLDDHGMLDSTIVYCAGEFGRTPRINARAGRDHWARSMAVLLAGGGFKRGFVYGSTDAQGMVPATDPCTPDDVAATIFHQLGIDPHQELQTAIGRPVQLFREGNVLSRLIE
jgi:uncharacterized protein (DUF1501 family)